MVKQDNIIKAGGLRLSGTTNNTLQVKGGVQNNAGTVPAVGSGFDAAQVERYIAEDNGVITTTLKVDIGGGSIVSSGSADDIIGEDGVANAYLTQLTDAINGVVFKIVMTCLELPTTGDTDINLVFGTSATDAEDAAVTGADVELNAGTHVLGRRVETASSATVTASDTKYVYLTHGGTTAGTYGAGQFLIQFYGAKLL